MHTGGKLFDIYPMAGYMLHPDHNVLEQQRAMAMAFGFIYIIFKCMGTTVVILGKSVDMGMLVYMSIVLFVMFVFGN
jgi:hypothetical protein